MSKPTTRRGIGHILDAFRYSAQGIRSVWQREEAFRLEAFIYGPFVILAFFVGTSPIYVALLIASVLLIFMAELINSAIEAVVDRISDEIHPLSGIAKDAGSAVVMTSLFISGILWLAALYERFGYLIFG